MKDEPLRVHDSTWGCFEIGRLTHQCDTTKGKPLPEDKLGNQACGREAFFMDVDRHLSPYINLGMGLLGSLSFEGIPLLVGFKGKPKGTNHFPDAPTAVTWFIR